MTYGVLINDAAGSVDRDALDQDIARIEAAFEAAGASAEVRAEPPDAFDRVMKELWAGPDRPEAIVIAGGDGTVNCAAGVAVGTDMVLGVLPMGTFNHFAKDLGMAVDLDGAVADLVRGEVRVVDVGEVNDRVFVNNSALGVYPAMVSVRERLADKKGWGKVRAVPVAVWRVLRYFPVHRLDLQGDGGYRRERERTPFVFVGNGGYEDEPGQVGTRSTIDTGTLALYVARVASRRALIWNVFRTVLSGSDAAREMDRTELTEVTIASGTRRVRVALDGEVTWMETPLRYRSRPGALRVMAPMPPRDTGSEQSPAEVVEHP